ncbi:hypothetical protein M231_06264 [Tremella mesenterica]|uniref:Uncharacterized protein n=1 Tax=Tremella mesenterica TaxID=5217 RepID=A0A4V1M3D4_TREME|nr:uncharacterized protein TREMEDRAFT_65045 [Tremella mesenterica DSM 1558]EIW66662.1 hypothetical protein TREMEDRAFT_65045 [Tremella mesenterica DSM 1558]RXK36480.1 hypothetical protein M231_06264 [Tremella mesenterica]
MYLIGNSTHEAFNEVLLGITLSLLAESYRIFPEPPECLTDPPRYTMKIEHHIWGSRDGNKLVSQLTLKIDNSLSASDNEPEIARSDDNRGWYHTLREHSTIVVPEGTTITGELETFGQNIQRLENKGFRKCSSFILRVETELMRDPSLQHSVGTIAERPEPPDELRMILSRTTS